MNKEFNAKKFLENLYTLAANQLGYEIEIEKIEKVESEEEKNKGEKVYVYETA